MRKQTLTGSLRKEFRANNDRGILRALELVSSVSELREAHSQLIQGI